MLLKNFVLQELFYRCTKAFDCERSNDATLFRFFVLYFIRMYSWYNHFSVFITPLSFHVSLNHPFEW